MTPTHEHYIYAGNILPKIRDNITLPSALNLTSAVLKFRYMKPGVETVERTATILNALPSLTAATSFDAEFAPTTDDTAVGNIGVWNYGWRLTPQGETAPIDLPNEVEPEVDGTPRAYQRFEILTPV